MVFVLSRGPEVFSEGAEIKEVRLTELEGEESEEVLSSCLDARVSSGSGGAGNPDGNDGGNSFESNSESLTTP